MILTPKLVSDMLITKLHRGADIESISVGLYKFLESYRSLYLLPAVRDSLARSLADMYQDNLCELVVSKNTDVSDEIAESIKSKHLENPTPDYHVRVDSSIVGGYVLRYRGVVYDNSLRYKLIALRQKLLA